MGRCINPSTVTVLSAERKERALCYTLCLCCLLLSVHCSLLLLFAKETLHVLSVNPRLSEMSPQLKMWLEETCIAKSAEVGSVFIVCLCLHEHLYSIRV